ncbi:MAG TPA: YHS domain-containing protein [Stellaceae bacterium]|nr:YHS domain-containing protein [Stellaceae bacterium]
MQAGNVLYFLVLAGLFFLMMRFGCGAHVMGHGHHHGGSRSDAGPDDNLRWVPPAKAVDPVCGMSVETAGAKSAVHEGQVYYFCAQNCREKFEAAPASFAKPAAATAAQGEKHHGC